MVEDNAKIAADKKAAEEKKLADDKIVAEKAAAEKKLADEKAEAEKKAAEEAAKKKEADEKAAAEAAKKSESKPEIKTLQQAQELLTKASEEIQSLKAETEQLKSDMSGLKDKSDKYTELMEKQKLESVGTLVQKKLSLGLIDGKEQEAQKDMLSKFGVKNIKLMTSELEKVKSVVRKESLKGSEGGVDDATLKVKKLMKGAGFKDEFIKSYKSEEE